ncbi:MAG: helix-turn-helix transcriptional regulator [Vicingus serpentipes]|nr:helix-turn-helix transcriptional regulator [Vicingus serpentipes]
MELIDRFKYLMKLNNLSASAFADKIGVQRSSVSHILSGRNKPSLEFIQKVLNEFPKVSAEWLINGKTNIENQETLTAPRITNTISEKITTPTPSNSDKQIKKIVVFYTDNTFEEIIKQ